MKVHIKKDWIQKFDHTKPESKWASIPIGPKLRLCGCGNSAIPDSDFCYECFEALNGEDEA